MTKAADKINLTTAGEFEEKLHLSHANKDVKVCVFDVYSSEWGPCKAIVETFKFLQKDLGDALRFYSVECNSVLSSLKDSKHKTKDTDYKETLAEFWEPILQARRGKSKPFFVFYKEGRKVGEVDGVNTPQIRELIKDFCAVRTPARDFLSNAKMLEMWEEHFNPEESEVQFDKFLKGLTVACKLTVPLNTTERNLLSEAIIPANSKDKLVTAEGLQKWIGDDESKTVLQVFTETLPDYEARATQVRIEREEADKKAAEEEERKKKEDEERRAKEKEADEAKQKEEDEQKKKDEEEDAKKKPASAADEARALDVEIREDLEDLSLESEADVAVTDKLKEAERLIAEGEEREGGGPTPAFALTPVAPDEAEEAAKKHVALLAAQRSLIRTCPAGTFVEMAHVADAVDRKLPAGNVSRIGKLAMMALSWGKESEFAKFFGAVDAEDFYSALADGSLFSKWVEQSPQLFAALAVAAARDADGVDVFLPKGAEDGQEVVLAPFTALRLSAGDDAAPVKGLTHVLPVGEFTCDKAPVAPAFALSRWWTTFKWNAEAGEWAAQGELLQDDYFGAASNYSAEANADDAKVTKIVKLREKILQRDDARVRAESEKPPTPPAKQEEEAPKEENNNDAAPAQEEKKEEEAAPPAAEEEKKADTPVEEEKKQDEAAPPAEEEKKAETPTEEKPANDDAAPATEEEKKADDAPPAEEEKKADTPVQEAKDEDAPAADEKKEEEAAPPADTDEAKKDEAADGDKPAEENKPADEEKPAAEDQPAADDKPADDEKKEEEKPAEEQ